MTNPANHMSASPAPPLPDSPAVPVATPNFEAALLRGDAKGYVICAKPLRFAKLPDDTVTTFAEIGPDRCYYVFECEADARLRLEQIPLEERLGFLFSIRTVHFAAAPASGTRPPLDETGHAFATPGVLVDRSGAKTWWRRPGRLKMEELPPADPPEVKPLSLRATLPN